MSSATGIYRLRFAVLLASVILLPGVSLGFGAASTAGQKVRDGIRLLRGGEFVAAGKAFAEADVAEPENPVICFDRACALAAAGDIEQARELFQQAALARDVDLAAQSHYNLGTLSASEGRAALGDEPVATPPEHRQQALALLLAAAGHYRDCLGLVADHSDARHNLELIRLFIKHIEAQWQERDRQQARDEMNLLDFLAMMRRRQAALRATLPELAQQADSPQRRQAAAEAAAEQAALKTEIEPLQAKIREQFQASQQPPPSAGSPSPDPAQVDPLQQARQLLTQLADEAGVLMEKARSSIAGGRFSAARAQQRDVLDQLNQIFMAVAPFSRVLQRATEQQQQLIETSEAVVGERESEPGDDAPSADAGKPPQESSDQPTPDAADSQLEWPELEWRQSLVRDWSRMLSLKAKSELPNVEAQLQTAGTPPPAADPTQTGQIDEQANRRDTDQDPQAQLEALKQSLQKAIELAPQVEQHTAAAAVKLGESDASGALPEQQQADELLREIAQPLTQQNQPQDPQSGDNENQADQEQNSGQSPSQPPAGADQDQQPPDTSPQEQALSTLRRARQRERQHRDLQKQLQQMMGGRARVDRDW